MVDKDEVTGQDLTELGADTSMADDSNIEGEIEDMDSMKDLYEQSFRNIQEGEVIRGRIVQISDDYVMVDIGYKSEGQISVHEFNY